MIRPVDLADIDRETERSYVLERLAEIREIIDDLLHEPIEPPRLQHTPNGGSSALEAIAAACYAAERKWTP